MWKEGDVHVYKQRGVEWKVYFLQNNSLGIQIFIPVSFLLVKEPLKFLFLIWCETAQLISFPVIHIIASRWIFSLENKKKSYRAEDLVSTESIALAQCCVLRITCSRSTKTTPPPPQIGTVSMSTFYFLNYNSSKSKVLQYFDNMKQNSTSPGATHWIYLYDLEHGLRIHSFRPIWTNLSKIF